jgi:hypothetical protein
MFRRFPIAALAASLAVSAAPAVAAGGSSSALLWQNKSKSVVCGLRIGSPLAKAPLLCSARGIPRKPHGGPVGDPFVQLARTGKPQLELISQNEWRTNKIKTLANGTSWSRNGVSCSVGKTVTCKNGAGHGFTIGNGKYKPF